MILRFYAKADALQRVPDFTPHIGQQDRYVGREYVPGEFVPSPEPGGDPVRLATFPATREAFECDSESPNGARLKHLTFRDRDLWPADQATADHCQVPYVELEFDDGEWVPKSAKKAPAVKAASPSKD